jgi:hypothetical protein
VSEMAVNWCGLRHKCIQLMVTLDHMCIQSKRCTHFKFRPVQHKQQMSVIHKLVANNTDNVLAKLMQNKPNIISKGSPNRRDSDRSDHQSSDKVMTRRMTVLNKQLLQAISDVLSTEQIGDELNELQVHITQVCLP